MVRISSCGRGRPPAQKAVRSRHSSRATGALTKRANNWLSKRWSRRMRQPRKARTLPAASPRPSVEDIGKIIRRRRTKWPNPPRSTDEAEDESGSVRDRRQGQSSGRRKGNRRARDPRPIVGCRAFENLCERMRMDLDAVARAGGERKGCTVLVQARLQAPDERHLALQPAGRQQREQMRGVDREQRVCLRRAPPANHE
jgi:hypothetical protein